MIRMQVYLPERQKRVLKRISYEEEKPMSEVLRELVDRGMEQRKKEKEEAKQKRAPKKTAGEFLLDMARDAKKYGFSGPPDLARNHDKYIYGDPRT